MRGISADLSGGGLYRWGVVGWADNDGGKEVSMPAAGLRCCGHSPACHCALRGWTDPCATGRRCRGGETLGEPGLLSVPGVPAKGMARGLDCCRWMPLASEPKHGNSAGCVCANVQIAMSCARDSESGEFCSPRAIKPISAMVVMEPCVESRSGESCGERPGEALGGGWGRWGRHHEVPSTTDHPTQRRELRGREYDLEGCPLGGEATPEATCPWELAEKCGW